jgi:hypothetical protein
VVSETIELTKSAFADVVGFMLDPCSSLLPGERPIPGTIPPDPEGCKHWIELLMVVQVADVAIDRALSRQQLDEAMGDARSGGVDAANKAMLRQVVDDFCGTPPRWPVPWPPPTRALDPKGLSAIQLLALGARFQAAADHLPDHALAPDLGSAADQLLGAGLARLAG